MTRRAASRRTRASPPQARGSRVDRAWRRVFPAPGFPRGLWEYGVPGHRANPAWPPPPLRPPAPRRGGGGGFLANRVLPRRKRAAREWTVRGDGSRDRDRLHLRIGEHDL